MLLDLARAAGTGRRRRAAGGAECRHELGCPPHLALASRVGRAQRTRVPLASRPASRVSRLSARDLGPGVATHPIGRLAAGGWRATRAAALGATRAAASGATRAAASRATRAAASGAARAAALRATRAASCAATAWAAAGRRAAARRARQVLAANTRDPARRLCAQGAGPVHPAQARCAAGWARRSAAHARAQEARPCCASAQQGVRSARPKRGRRAAHLGGRGQAGACPRPSGSPVPVRLLTGPADERGQAEARGSASLVPLPPAAPG